MTASTATRRGIPGRPRAWDDEDPRNRPGVWEEFWEGRLLDQVGNLRVLEDPPGSGEWALLFDYRSDLITHLKLLEMYGPPPCRQDALSHRAMMADALSYGSRETAESEKRSLEDYLKTYRSNKPPLRDDMESLPPDLRVSVK